MTTTTTQFRRRSAVALLLPVLLLLAAASAIAAQDQQGAPQEAASFEAAFAAAGWDATPGEIDEALDKWADQFVPYLITDEEEEIFESLATREQKLAFTERFWDIRDPTPGTSKNEYREEHLERWVTANRRFSAGKPGWATDRGRVYIILGTPHNLQRNPMGRDGMERASEVWSYNLPDNPMLPGVLDLSFVDFHGTGEFELVSDLDMAAPIMTQQFGYVNNPLDVLSLRRHANSIYDERFLTYSWADPTAVARDFLDFQQNLREVLRIPDIQRERLAALRSGSVETSVDFDAFPIAYSVDFYEAMGGVTAVQITLAVEYDFLRPAPFGEAVHFSTDLYAAIEKDAAPLVDDEKRVNFSLTESEYRGLLGTQILQEFRLIVPPGSYDLVIMGRDNTSAAIGRRVFDLQVPELTGEALRVSSLTLASRIEQVPIAAQGEPRDFQHGDMRVVPNVNRAYYPDQMLLLYVQAYGIAINPGSGANSITLRGELLRDGQRVRRIPEQHPFPAPLSRQSFSLGLPLTGYRPGVYEVRLEIVDEIADITRELSGEFAVLPPLRPTASR